jgi:hypothetical protein
MASLIHRPQTIGRLLLQTQHLLGFGPKAYWLLVLRVVPRPKF